jgi:hypothetical protein
MPREGGTSSSMKRRTVFAIVVLVPWLAAAFVSQGQSTQLVAWDAEAPLSWDLFQGSAPAHAAQLSEAAAIHVTIKWHASYVIQSQLGSSPRWIGAVDRVTVANLMNPRLSWVFLEKATPEVLRHEQAHFDLNEVYRGKLEAHLACLREGGRTADETQAALDARIHSTADAVLDQLSVMQSRYDDETGHGTDPAAQAEWEEHVAFWLTEPLRAP